MKYVLAFLMCALFIFSGYDAFAKSTSTTSSSRSSSSSTRSSNSMSSGTYKSPNKPAYVAPAPKPVVVQSRPVVTQPRPVVVQQSTPVQVKQVVVNKPVDNVVQIRKDIPTQRNNVVVNKQYVPSGNSGYYNSNPDVVVVNNYIPAPPRVNVGGVTANVVKQQFRLKMLPNCKGWDCK